MATEWYRNGNEVVSRKIAGKKHIEDRRKIGYSQVNNPIILRISYVYVTYILRIWYVIDKEKAREEIGIAGEMQNTYINTLGRGKMD